MGFVESGNIFTLSAYGKRREREIRFVMSVYGSSNTPFVVGALCAAALGMAVWCGYALHGQMKTEEIQSRMAALRAVVCNYAADNGGRCPEDLGVLFEAAYCSDGKLYRVPGETALPKSGSDVRAGLCDFAYMGKGMKLDKEDLKKRSGRAFPLLHLKGPFRGSWLVVYSDGQSEAYDGRPGFIKDASAKDAPKPPAAPPAQ